jgi:hypothetical protein
VGNWKTKVLGCHFHWFWYTPFHSKSKGTAMDALTMYAAYMTAVVALVGLWAARVPHENIRTVLVLSLVWPLSILAILGFIAMDAIGWNMDTAPSDKLFGFRRATNPKAKGFAVAAFGVELQFYKMK